MCSNSRAEVLAITTAADLFPSCDKALGSVSIFTDSLSTLQALDSPDPGPLVQSLKAALATLTKKAPTTLQWVPAHVGLSGNEHADRLAKEGSRLTQPTPPATYEKIKTLLRGRFRKHWVNLNSGYIAHKDPIRTLDRKHQTQIFRMRTGHCGLRAHLKRIGATDTPMCHCGRAEQTPAHALQDFPLYDEMRQQTWPEGADLDTKLWATAADLYRTSRFAAALGLCA